MQAYCRLVEHVADTDQAASNLRRQADSLCLAPGKSAAHPIQRQVSEPDVHHKLQPGLYLLEDLGRNHSPLFVQFQLAEEPLRLLNTQAGQLAYILSPDGHGGRFVNIRDGSVDWPLVRAELDKIGYNGWMTIEGSGGLSLQERSKRLDLIIAGK